MNTEPLAPYNAARDYYGGPRIADRLRAALTDAGLDPDALHIDDLAALDEFHALGRPATLALAKLVPVHPGDRVLDAGAGIGGPARFLAARYDAHVTALDATPRFCEAAELLTRGVGLQDQVEIVEGDVLAIPFADASFDLSWTQAVSQNIEDKRQFVSELARVTRPGGHVALFEVVAGPGGPLEFPVPWADREDQSWLATATALRELIESQPLTIVTWNQGPAALESIGAAAQSLRLPEAADRPGLALLMPDYDARMAAMARNVAGQRVELVQAVARRDG